MNTLLLVLGIAAYLALGVAVVYFVLCLDRRPKIGATVPLAPAATPSFQVSEKSDHPNFLVMARFYKTHQGGTLMEYVRVSDSRFNEKGDLLVSLDYWPSVAPSAWDEEAMGNFRSKLRGYMLANGRGVSHLDALLDCAEYAARETLHPLATMEIPDGNR